MAEIGRRRYLSRRLHMPHHCKDKPPQCLRTDCYGVRMPSTYSTFLKRDVRFHPPHAPSVLALVDTRYESSASNMRKQAHIGTCRPCRNLIPNRGTQTTACSLTDRTPTSPPPQLLRLPRRQGKSQQPSRTTAQTLPAIALLLGCRHPTASHLLPLTFRHATRRNIRLAKAGCERDRASESRSLRDLHGSVGRDLRVTNCSR